MPDYGKPPPPADTVTLGGGAWNGPDEPRRKRTWWYVGGGIVAALALVVGGTVYAASQVGDHRDPGPAAGLPSDTLAYAAVDLDPSAGQKIEAIKALRRFPAFTDGVKVDPTSDLRKLLIQDELKTDGCHLDWDKDVAPWLGDDVGAAVVPTTGQGPQPVVILAVTDEAAATKDLPRFLTCLGVQQGLSVADGWAVVAKDDATAKNVAAATRNGSLADDDDFRTWTERSGDAGVATFYASPDAGAAMATSLDDLAGRIDKSGVSSGHGSSGVTGEFAPAAYDTRALTADPSDPFGGLLGICPGALGGGRGGSPLSGAQLQAEKQQLAKLQGGAATLRFSHSGFELETASSVAGAKQTSGSSGLTTLPADTALAFGSAGAGDAIDRIADGFAQGFVAQCGGSPAKLWNALSSLTGLSMPTDLTTLFGGGVTFALSGATDPDEVANGGPGSLPAGVLLKGDPDRIADVLAKIALPGAQQLLAASKGDGVVAVGPDADYRAQLLKKGSLGDTKEFTDVVPHADQASAAFYISFDNLKTIIDSDAGGYSAQERANLAHLQALGSSSWVDDDGIGHGLLRLSTK